MRFGIGLVSNFFTAVAVSAALLFFAQNAGAESARQCRALFEKTTFVGALQLVESPISAPLTSEMREILHRHSIWKYHEGTGGAGLFFEFPRRIAARNTILHEREIISGFKGESIQTHFIAQTLREIFPHAQLYQDRAPSLRKKIQVEASDYAEHGLPDLKSFKIIHQHQFATYNQLSMPLLKMANGRSIGISKRELRARLGILESKNVFSFYNFDLSGIEISDFLNGLRGSEKSLENLVLFASYRHEALHSDYAVHELHRLLDGKAVIHLLSTLQSDDLTQPGPHLVVNDTSGLLPVINRLSDLMVVAGPVNLFEGLNAGTPTLFSSKIREGGETNYNKKTFEMLMDTALKSGGAYDYKNLDDLLGQIPLALKNKDLPIPSYLVEENGRTWFEHYLDSLQEILDKTVPSLH